jgi:hypothetical protein
MLWSQTPFLDCSVVTNKESKRDTNFVKAENSFWKTKLISHKKLSCNIKLEDKLLLPSTLSSSRYTVKTYQNSGT